MNTTSNSNNTVQCYSAWTKNDAIRTQSSSGGIFYEFANLVIKKGGVVIGAAFCPDGSVALQSAENSEELYRLIGSKYVQSKTQGIFVYVKGQLKNGKVVAFCGTPCQCNALIKYLNGWHPDNLLLIDFICHGVPSESVWEKYLTYRANGKQQQSLSFRDKRISWGDFGMRMVFQDGSEYFSRHQEDPYMRLFLANRVLRPSCHKCRAKGEKRSADITLGDFWGIKEKGTKGGCSVLFVRSPLGEKLYQAIQSQLVTSQLSFDKAVNNNSNYFQSCGVPFNRDTVLKAINEDAEKVFANPDPYIQTSLIEKVIRKSIRIAGNAKKHLGFEKENCYLSTVQIGKSGSFSVRAECCGCGACAAICQTKAISMRLDEEGFWYPVVEEQKCCHCNKCVKICLYSEYLNKKD